MKSYFFHSGGEDIAGLEQKFVLLPLGPKKGFFSVVTAVVVVVVARVIRSCFANKHPEGRMRSGTGAG